jgi:hypothetical protein
MQARKMKKAASSGIPDGSLQLFRVLHLMKDHYNGLVSLLESGISRPLDRFGQI